MAVRLVFDVLSGRFWTTPFIDIFEQKATDKRTPTEDGSKTPWQQSSNNTNDTNNKRQTVSVMNDPVATEEGERNTDHITPTEYGCISNTQQQISSNTTLTNETKTEGQGTGDTNESASNTEELSETECTVTTVGITQHPYSSTNSAADTDTGGQSNEPAEIEGEQKATDKRTPTEDGSKTPWQQSSNNTNDTNNKRQTVSVMNDPVATEEGERDTDHISPTEYTCISNIPQQISSNTTLTHEIKTEGQATGDKNHSAANAEELSETECTATTVGVTLQPHSSTNSADNDTGTRGHSTDDTNDPDGNEGGDGALSETTSKSVRKGCEMAGTYTPSVKSSVKNASQSSNESPSTILSGQDAWFTTEKRQLVRLESKVEVDATPSFQDYTDSTYRNRGLQDEQASQPRRANNWQTVYEREFQHTFEKAVDCIEERVDDSLKVIALEGKAGVQQITDCKNAALEELELKKDLRREEVPLYDIKDILILHSDSDQDRTLAHEIKERITTKSDQSVGPLVDVYDNVAIGESRLDCIDDIFTRYRWVLFLVTQEYIDHGFQNFQGSAVLIKELEGNGNKHGRFVPLLSGVERKQITRGWLKAIQPMYLTDKNFISMIIQHVQKFRKVKL